METNAQNKKIKPNWTDDGCWSANKYSPTLWSAVGLAWRSRLRGWWWERSWWDRRAWSGADTPCKPPPHLPHLHAQARAHNNVKLFDNLSNIGCSDWLTYQHKRDALGWNWEETRGKPARNNKFIDWLKWHAHIFTPPHPPHPNTFASHCRSVDLPAMWGGFGLQSQRRETSCHYTGGIYNTTRGDKTF